MSESAGSQIADIKREQGGTLKSDYFESDSRIGHYSPIVSRHVDLDVLHDDMSQHAKEIAIKYS